MVQDSNNIISGFSAEEFLNRDIFDLMGVGDMPEEKKRDLYIKILETVQNRVNARIADNLDEKAMQEWREVKKTNDKKKMQDFMNARGINIEKLFLQETLIYKTELVELSKPIRDARKKNKE